MTQRSTHRGLSSCVSEHSSRRWVMSDREIWVSREMEKQRRTSIVGGPDQLKSERVLMDCQLFSTLRGK